MLRFFRTFIGCFVLLTSLCLQLGSARADEQATIKGSTETPTGQAPRGRLLNNALGKISIFQKDFNVKGFFDVEDAKVVQVPNEEEKKIAVASPTPTSSPAAAQPTSESPVAKPNDVEADDAVKGPRFVRKFQPQDLLPPDKTPRLRIEADAPSSVVGMVDAHEKGDDELASAYADQHVRYLQNYFFEVRELTDIIGKALVRQKVIKESDWDGVEQFIDYQMAKTRDEKREILRPTHETAMERIKPDTKGKAEVYFFMTLNCSYCRFMAPEVERLWRSVKNDPNVKMTALTLGPIPQGWVEEYRSYTGATFPVLNGEQVAKALNIRFVPALVVLAPNSKTAYFKSGQQTFARMYEFVRKVQGLPSSLTPVIQTLIDTPIGEQELTQVKKGEWKLARLGQDESSRLKPLPVQVTKKDPKNDIGRF